MNRRFDEQAFLGLRRQHEGAMQLALRGREILLHRPAASFDGFGHFLDSVLPDEQEGATGLAAVLHVSAQELERLRASLLDPLSVAPTILALIGQLVGLTPDELERMVVQDHERFSGFSSRVNARDVGRDTGSFLSELRSACARLAEDSAADM
jgi:hypothetical protein